MTTEEGGGRFVWRGNEFGRVPADTDGTGGVEGRGLTVGGRLGAELEGSAGACNQREFV